MAASLPCIESELSPAPKPLVVAPESACRTSTSPAAGAMTRPTLQLPEASRGVPELFGAARAAASPWLPPCPDLLPHRRAGECDARAPQVALQPRHGWSLQELPQPHGSDLKFVSSLESTVPSRIRTPVPHLRAPSAPLPRLAFIECRCEHGQGQPVVSPSGFRFSDMLCSCRAKSIIFHNCVVAQLVSVLGWI